MFKEFVKSKAAKNFDQVIIEPVLKLVDLQKNDD